MKEIKLFLFVAILLWFPVVLALVYRGCPEIECTKEEYGELLFTVKALSAEKSRLEYELSSGGTVISAPYEVPVDIQQPLPYIYE
jgi:hypothetical protein